MANERLRELRTLMKVRNVDAYYVPSSDFHDSEYVEDYFKCRAFLSGFTGSAGTMVITQAFSGMWTDGRYFVQAEKQLKDSGFTLQKMGQEGVPSINEYLQKVMPEGGKLGFDGRVINDQMGAGLQEALEDKHVTISYEEDLVGEIWENRPALSAEPVWILEEKYAGKSAAQKIEDLRGEMKKLHADVHVLTTVDDIVWLLNIRGNDIDFFPLVLSYGIITMDSFELYIDERKLDDKLKAKLAKDGVNLHPYNDIYEDVKKFGSDVVAMIDPGKLNYALFNNIPENVKTVKKRNPAILMKAIKNPVEIENIRKAQIKDSVAHVRFMKWLKENVGKMRITEMSASDKLDEFRAEMGKFIRPSFEPISSFGEHGAIVHYTSSPETDVELKEGQLFLTDTGAGFYEGSTDVTRTYALGEVPQIMKDHFTLVAISNLQLGSAKFLEGSTGMILDILARKPFWDRDLNFNHGTGHGVGYLLNIHEGPAGFRWKYRKGETEVLQEGMVITDEPGIYIEGSHGIRLENELLTCKGTLNEYGQFMYFEAITLIPMDLDAINPDIMTQEDKKLLNDYHAKVYEVIAPYLNEEEQEWLKKYTRAI